MLMAMSLRERGDRNADMVKIQIKCLHVWRTSAQGGLGDANSSSISHYVDRREWIRHKISLQCNFTHRLWRKLLIRSGLDVQV